MFLTFSLSLLLLQILEVSEAIFWGSSFTLLLMRMLTEELADCFGLSFLIEALMREEEVFQWFLSEFFFVVFDSSFFFCS